jgi:membrane protein DedA with SNARE-associated domain
MLELVKDWAIWGVQSGGYFGAGVLMALESMLAPVPSEMVMPPMGMLIHEGRFSWAGAITVSSLGSMVGSIISYYMGYWGGKPFVLKVGKYLLLSKHELDLTTRWFQHHGASTVFIARFVPFVRHFISIPAGIARMSFLRFCVYTLIGATMWNTILLYAGYKLQEHWEVILKYRTPIDIGVGALLVAGAAIWVTVMLRARRHHPVAESPGQPEIEP